MVLAVLVVMVFTRYVGCFVLSFSVAVPFDTSMLIRGSHFLVEVRYKMFDVSTLKLVDVLRKDFKKWTRVGLEMHYPLVLLFDKN